MDFYAYTRLLGKIEDIPELRQEYINVFDSKSNEELVRFCLLYGQELLASYPYKTLPVIEEGFEAMQDWLDGKVNFHPARNASFALNRQIRDEKDRVRKRFYQTISQLLASPHVRFHALWATDFAISLINRKDPGNLDLVNQERRKLIGILSKE